MPVKPGRGRKMSFKLARLKTRPQASHLVLSASNNSKRQTNRGKYPATGEDANIDAWTQRIVVLGHSNA